MPELLEKVWVALLPHDKDRCPFCEYKKTYSSPDSKVSDANDSQTLGRNLNATGKPDDSEVHHFLDMVAKTGGVHGKYTLQAHHLICGNEILGEQKVIQSFLCKQGRHDGKLQPCETGYDINSAANGIWLPSTPAQFKTAIKLKTALKREVAPGTYTNKELDEMASFAAAFPEFLSMFRSELTAMGVNTKKLWTNMTDDEQDAIAQVVMLKAQRQFHLGEHDGAVPAKDRAERSYVQRGIKHLNTLTVFMQHYADGCPMGKATPPKEPPYVPPFKLNRHLDVLSKQMRAYVVGDPRRWRYFISKWAMRLTDRLNASTPT
ncbi:MAG: AHH domain-containing protein [Burkholderiales bacterium]|nr:AHH domain-containing protein [Burkholderiales bacterium]